ncbi:hypothetical protein E4J89_15715 [Arthrobacter sp. CAU 1506]|uniref:hypothetical protein n=1 Tax=Arthrobacter sp. CAU 1506 TaxID=2560052 RepID=UPI0010AD1D61|nr:hypothetical protein [Arthrobacter sp. CAU 1506]TJY67329.1 hypothetical protein E4J89_15715 [Arthrobacter sp. CAU 1506]
MDTSRPPHGERQRKALLAEIVAGGDTAEKHYLEIKRQLDFSSKEETTKIAKFILGAANRLPATAERHYGGHAVMVIGAEQGGLPGVPAGTEVLDIEQKINKFLLPGGPQWELERAPADTPGQEVLFILVDPPQDGDPIYLCRANFQGSKVNLSNGDIYVRAQGQTRKATAPEIDDLMTRAGKKSLPVPELTVTLEGGAHHLDLTPERLNQFIVSNVEKARTEHLSPTTSAAAQGGPLLAGLNAQILLGLDPSSLSPEAFERQALEWENQIRAEWQETLGRIAGAALPGLVIELGNRQSTFLEAVRFDLRLKEAYGVNTEDADDVTPKKLFPPVIVKRSPFDHGLGFSPSHHNSISSTLSRYPLKWKNVGENLHITIELDQLRPGTPWASDGDDFVVISRHNVSTLSGTWRATIRGHHQAFDGAVSLPVRADHNIQTLYRQLDDKAQ